jgi:hypothetical protein
MKATGPTKLLAPVLILGAALPASAQQPATSAAGFGCYIAI